VSDLFRLDLRKFGAPGFEIRDRLDMTGHRSGRVIPHINSEVVVAGTDKRVIVKSRQDLAANQVPGFNGMQQLHSAADKWTPADQFKPVDWSKR